MSASRGSLCIDLLGRLDVPSALPVSSIGLGEFIFALTYFINATVMLRWIYQHRRNALLGMDGAAMYVIFPVYIPVMWMSVFCDVSIGLFTLFSPIDENGDSYAVSSIAGLVYGLQHFVLEGIAFIMMQYGCGYEAGKKASILAGIWAIVTFLEQLFFYHSGPTTFSYSIDILWNVILLLFYLALWLVPEKNLFRRPSVLLYAKFWVVIRLLYLLADILAIIFDSVQYEDREYVGVYCFVSYLTMLIFVVCKPYIIYSTLLSDSSWWQGLGQRKLSTASNFSEESSLSNVETFGPTTMSTVYDPARSSWQNTQALTNAALQEQRQSKYSKKNSSISQLSKPLLGMEVGFSDAQELAKEVDNLRAKGDVRLLNFAYISLKTRSKILGSGSFSKVYSGEYRKQPVAIKMMFTPDLNPEVIRRCCNEAEILTAVKHENVVKIFGVSVLPPSVCIVLEKCEYGSLSDILRGRNPDGNTSSSQKKFPLRLTKTDRMFLALGCARGLAALHGSSLTLCHRDIKSFNFLVDSQLVVKIADLELGNDNEVEDDHSYLLDDNSHSDSLSIRSNSRSNASVASISAISPSRLTPRKKSLNRFDDMLASWQSPEVLLGGVYQQSSDVYSLALVLWEIVASASWDSSCILGKSFLPFGNYSSQSEVREKIISGERPPLPKSLDDKYLVILTSSWQSNPSLRPTSQVIANTLFQCWLDCVYSCVRETANVVSLIPVNESYKQHELNRSSRDKTMTRNQETMGKSSSTFATPSPLLLSAVANMSLDKRWRLLEGEGSFIVLSAIKPFCVLWATKAWSELTGFLLNEILADDLQFLFSNQTNRKLIDLVLASASEGCARHVLTPLWRRDRNQFLASVHAFPIFSSDTDVQRSQGNIDEITNSNATATSPRESIQGIFRRVQSFSPFFSAPTDDSTDSNTAPRKISKSDTNSSSNELNRLTETQIRQNSTAARKSMWDFLRQGNTSSTYDGVLFEPDKIYESNQVERDAHLAVSFIVVQMSALEMFR